MMGRGLGIGGIREVKSNEDVKINGNKGRIESREWYSEERLKFLLERYVGGDNVSVLQPLSSMEQLTHHLQQLVRSDVAGEVNEVDEALSPTKSQYIIPLNINALTRTFDSGNNNHWVGLYVVTNNSNKTANSNKTTLIYYIDTMGYPINGDLVDIISQVFKASFKSIAIEQPLKDHPIQYVDQISDIELIGNKDDCGPMLIYALACLVRAVEVIKISSLEESVSLGAFLRQEFDKQNDFKDIYLTINKNNQNNTSQTDAVRVQDQVQAEAAAGVGTFRIDDEVNENKDEDVDEGKLLGVPDLESIVPLGEEIAELDQLAVSDEEITELERKLFPELASDAAVKLPDPEVERAKTLELIEQSYKRGLEYYKAGKAGDLKSAEKELVEVLKPTLSKPTMKSLYVNTEDVKEAVLDAMYHLGLIYLNDTEYFNNYTKAACIFQYCAGFAEKYKCSIKLADNTLSDKQYFIKQAYLVEKEFLNGIGRSSNSDTNNNDDNNSSNSSNYLSINNVLDEEYCSQYEAKFAEYRRDLEAIRTKTKQRLAEIEDITVEDIAKRVEAVEDIYRNCTSFFVNSNYVKRNNISNKDEKPGLIQRLLKDCFEELGNPPEGSEYAIVSSGSGALGTMTPWSDFEGMILVNADEYKDYFRNLAKLLQIKVINLGETHLKSMGVESLNNFKTGEEADEWFWDDVMKIKFNFDSARWDACKVPLGRQGGHKVKKTIKNEQGIEETIIIDKPDYELILTPEQMAAFQKEARDSIATDNQELHSTTDINNTTNINTDTNIGVNADTNINTYTRKEISWFESDKHLVQALRSVSLIDGSQRLLDEYRAKILQVVDKSVLQDRALKILLEDVNKFSLKLGDEEEGKLINSKQDIYRLGDRVVSGLSNYYNITAEEGQPSITVWQMLERMRDEGIISSDGAQHLKEALAIATELRLRAYAKNDTREERVSTYVPAVEHLSDEQKKQLIDETFHITDTSILHHFYYVMLAVQTIMKEFGDQDKRGAIELALKSNNLIDKSSYSKGMVHARFLEYDQALKYMEAAKEEKPQNLKILNDLYFLYSKTAIIENTIKTANEILTLQKNNHKKNSSHPDVAVSYDNLGNAYRDKGEYQQAINYYKQALKIFFEAYKDTPDHPDIAINYDRLGNVYRDNGEYQQAIKYCQLALYIKLNVYKNNSNHPYIATTYNNLGNVYRDKGEYQQAIKYYQLALEILIEAYKDTPNHPEIAGSYSNLGNVYHDDGNYEKSIMYCKLALEIELAVYKNNSNHPYIAATYNNLGNVYRDKGEYQQAIKYYKLALDIESKVYKNSPNHPSIAAIYNNLGSVDHIQGNYQQAMISYEFALEIYLKAYGEKSCHPNIAQSYNNLGAIYSDIGKYKEGIKYHNKALEIYGRTPHHPYFAYSWNNLGKLFHIQEDYSQAKTSYEFALEIYLKAYGEKSCHPNIGNTHYNLGLTYFVEGSFDYAFTHACEALRIFSIFQGQKNITRFKMLYDFVLVQLGNVEYLSSNEEKAQEYYCKLIDKRYKELDIRSKIFIDLQHNYGNIAYKSFALSAALNCQLVLTKVDPNLSFGNHYHNLACYYINKGEVKLAYETFLKAFNAPGVKIALYAEYAQFLILNIDNLNINREKISELLYTIIKNDDDGSALQFGKLEKNFVDIILKNIIESKNDIIKVHPKSLSYYLLIKHPEYLAENDNIGNILKSFNDFCNIRQDEIAFELLAYASKLLEDASRSVNDYEHFSELLSIIESQTPQEINQTDEITESTIILLTEEEELQQAINMSLGNNAQASISNFSTFTGEIPRDSDV